MVLSKLSEPTNDFGLRFLEHLNCSNDNKNVLFSPLSVILAFGMLLEGATEETEQQIIKVLQLSCVGDKTAVSQASKLLLQVYKLIEDGSSDRNFSLTIGNLAAFNKHVIREIKEDFVESLSANYYAQVSNEDFQNGAEFVNRINSWITEKTFGKMNILPGPPDPETILILVNTVYFKGQWVEPFKKSDTFYGTFTNSDDTISRIKSMTFRGKKFNYAHDQTKKLKIIDLPYKGNVSMIIILPTEENTLSSLVPTLNATELNDLMRSMKQTKLGVVKIPKFKLEDTHKLHKILPSMGMKLPFDKFAQRFDIAVDPKVFVYVSRSIQKALIEVDEEGTVAAAITRLMCKSTGGKNTSVPEDFIVDRPFLFMIRDNLTGVNLFVGQMNNMPSFKTAKSPAVELIIEQRTRQQFKKNKVTD